MQSIYPELLYPLQAAVTLGAFLLIWRRGLPPLGRTDVARWGAAWIFAATAVFWVLGPWSFNAVQFELDFAVPIHQYVATLPPGTRFAHGFAGGLDAYALNQFSGQFVSLERFLVSALPTWLGLAIYRVLLFSLSFVGSYRLSRALGADRAVAFALAILASVANDGVTVHAFSNGTAIAALPLAIYLIVLRFGRPRYWLGVVVFGLFHAASCTVPITILNYLFVLPLAALIIGWRRLVEIVPGMAVVMGLALLNLHETIYGIAMVAPYTARGGGRTVEVVEMLSLIADSLVVVLAAAIGLAVMAAGREFSEGAAMRRRAAVAVVLFAPVVAGIAALPWASMGLSAVQNLGWSYLRFGFLSLAVILVALAAAGLARAATKRRILLAAVLAALAVGKLAHYSLYEALIWLSGGGLSYARLDDLKNPAWAPSDPFRVAAVPWRLAENQLPALGFDSAVGITSLQPAVTVPFWAAVNTGDPDARITFTTGPSLSPRLNEGVAKCCTDYDIVKFGIDPALLQVANVRFLLSRLPLSGGGLAKVAGPPEGTVLPRDGVPLRQRILPYIRWIVQPDPVYVYELPRPVPRVFAAIGGVVVADDASNRDFLALVRAKAPDGTAVLRASDAARLGPVAQTPVILSYAKVLNGYDIDLDGNRGGVVVVNVPFTPFWRGRVDGAEAPVVAADGIHMAIAVPPGGKRVTVRYERPLLREKIAEAIGRLGGARDQERTP